MRMYNEISKRLIDFLREFAAAQIIFLFSCKRQFEFLVIKITAHKAIIKCDRTIAYAGIECETSLFRNDIYTSK